MITIEKMKEMVDKRDRLNDGWIPDWSDNDKLKYSISKISNGNGQIELHIKYFNHTNHSGLNFKTEELAQEFIKSFNQNEIIDLINTNIDLSRFEKTELIKNETISAPQTDKTKEQLFEAKIKSNLIDMFLKLFQSDEYQFNLDVESLDIIKFKFFKKSILKNNGEN